jgi:hypothetical protein
MNVDKEEDDVMTLDNINSSDIPSSEIPSSSGAC